MKKKEIESYRSDLPKIIRELESVLNKRGKAYQEAQEFLNMKSDEYFKADGIRLKKGTFEALADYASNDGQVVFPGMVLDRFINAAIVNELKKRGVIS